VDYQDFASENDEMAVLVADNRLAELAMTDLNTLESVIKDLQVADFDTILTGFEDGDLESLLGRVGEAAEEDGEAEPADEDLGKGDVTIALGLYRFKLTQEEYLAWIDRVKQTVGFDKESVTKELHRRLGI
jgi:hypothetical protein